MTTDPTNLLLHSAVQQLESLVVVEPVVADAAGCGDAVMNPGIGLDVESNGESVTREQGGSVTGEQDGSVAGAQDGSVTGEQEEFTAPASELSTICSSEGDMRKEEGTYSTISEGSLQIFSESEDEDLSYSPITDDEHTLL